MKKYTENLQMDKNMQEKEVIVHVAKKHIEFERIHPFKDGNVPLRYQQQIAA